MKISKVMFIFVIASLLFGCNTNPNVLDRIDIPSHFIGVWLPYSEAPADDLFSGSVIKMNHGDILVAADLSCMEWVSINTLIQAGKLSISLQDSEDSYTYILKFNEDDNKYFFSLIGTPGDRLILELTVTNTITAFQYKVLFTNVEG